MGFGKVSKRKAPDEEYCMAKDLYIYVLYIEDERPVIDLVREALKLAGFKVVGATSGRQGLALMRERKPDLILLDLMMPDLNGWDVYREMKKDANLAKIPVIVVSAKVPDHGKTIIDDLPPVNDYITKPFDVEQLIRSVKGLLVNGKL
jgi:DNA-binding response OmpR family regulator